MKLKIGSLISIAVGFFAYIINFSLFLGLFREAQSGGINFVYKTRGISFFIFLLLYLSLTVFTVIMLVGMDNKRFIEKVKKAIGIDISNNAQSFLLFLLLLVLGVYIFNFI